MGVNLGYGTVQPTGIETNPNSFYSAKKMDAFKDWLNKGELQSGPNYKEVYMNKGNPLGKYVNGAEAIFETNSPRVGTASNGFPTIPSITNKDAYTVYRRTPEGGFSKFYQNIPSEVIRGGGMLPTAMSKISPYIPQAIKTGASALGGFLNKANLPMLVGQAAWNANEDQRNRNDYQERARDFASIPKDTELRMPR